MQMLVNTFNKQSPALCNVLLNANITTRQLDNLSINMIFF